MNSRLNKQLTEIVEKISKIKNVYAIYLFGSFAREEERPNSDVDICVMGDLTTEEKTDIYFYGEEKFDISFFDEIPIIIQVRVFSEGKPLFIRDEDRVQKIAWVTLYKYREISPLIERRVNEMFHNDR